MTTPFTAFAFNEHLKTHKLMGAHCASCDATFVPPREICPKDFTHKLAWVELSGSGTLVALTAVHIVPTAMEAKGYGRNNPYLSGIVELEDGMKVSARILGAAGPSLDLIGKPVHVAFLDDKAQDGEATTTLAFELI